MTVEALSSLPLTAGSAVAAAAGRTALWALSAYMRAPLRNTAIAALVGLSAMAGSNALYMQAHRLPAPLFGSFDADAAAPAKSEAKARTTPVHPATRPAKLELATSPETTGSVEPQATRPIGNADVIDVQNKLKVFGIFSGKVDGLYGPQTAAAIRAFEQKVGRTPRGELTPEIVELIRSTDSIVPASVTAAVPTATETPASVVATPAPAALSTSAPAASTTASVTPATLNLVQAAEPLPTPAPLSAITQAVTTKDDTATLTVATAEPEPVAATDPAPASVSKRVVPTIAVHAESATAQPLPPALTDADPATLSTDPQVVAAVQRGLSSLGFLHGDIDGVAGEATAKAIRNFEVYFNYNVTGRISPGLVNLLVQNGAVI